MFLTTMGNALTSQQPLHHIEFFNYTNTTCLKLIKLNSIYISEYLMNVNAEGYVFFYHNVEVRYSINILFDNLIYLVF